MTCEQLQKVSQEDFYRKIFTSNYDLKIKGDWHERTYTHLNGELFGKQEENNYFIKKGFNE